MKRAENPRFGKPDQTEQPKVEATTPMHETTAWSCNNCRCDFIFAVTSPTRCQYADRRRSSSGSSEVLENMVLVDGTLEHQGEMATMDVAQTGALAEIRTPALPIGLPCRAI